LAREKRRSSGRLHLDKLAGLPQRFRFQALVFTASFLAFCLELAAAKLLLPRFGGSAYVWTGSMVFFQAVLLAAYLYARRASSFPRFYAAALALPLFFLPLALPSSSPLANPYAELFRALLLCVGAPFFVLSTTVVVAQSWLMRSALPERKDGYFLYAASNLGAAAGLLTYPLVIEPLLSLNAQGTLWQVLYAGYAALCWSCAAKGAAKHAPASGRPSTGRERALWLLLSAAPCAALLAATNLLGMDFAAVPLLWIAPLAVYLLTFVLNFKRTPWYPERLNRAMLPVAALCVLLALWVLKGSTTVTFSRLLDLGKFGYVLFALFALSMIFHRSLAAGRPASERAMAEYYGCIAAGGLMGSVLVGLLVPWLGRHVGATALDWAAVAAVAAAAIVLRDWEQLKKNKKTAAALAAVALIALAGVTKAGNRPGRVYSLRNFYGIYSVEDRAGVRWFFHGNTDHGMQFTAPERQREPLAYYGFASPLGDAWGALGSGWRSVGVVGLGAGSIAAYGRPGMAMDFYELDPDVVLIAKALFSHLRLSAATIRVITGDARLSLELANGTEYDAIILDAFNSGSVPIHLLTTEAFGVYLRRLKPNGIILLHISNRYLDLRPVLGAAARDLGLSGASKRQVFTGETEDGRAASVWVALGREAAIKTLVKEGWSALDGSRASAWTDRHASLLPALAL